MITRTAYRIPALTAMSTMCAATVVVLAPFAGADPGTVVNGTITSDTTWTAADSPYLVHGPITIPEGVTLTVEPGVVVDIPYSFLTDGKGTFNVSGALDIVGTPEAPVELDGGDQSWNTSLVRVYEAGGPPPEVTITHASIHDFTAVVGVSSAGGRFELTDSRVYRSGGTHLATRNGSVVSRNFFEDAGGVNLLGQSPVMVTNNRFRENGYSWSSSQPFVSSQNSGGVPDQVHDNTFEPQFLIDGSSPRPAVSIAPDGAIDASRNYWHTTDVSAVKARIYDSEDNPTWSSTVPVEPLLPSPAPQTPAAPPQAVTSLTMVGSTSSSATIGWQHPASDGGSPVTGFRVSVPATGFVSDVPPEVRTFTVGGLPSGSMHTIVVIARNASGTSLPRELRVMTQSGQSEAPVPTPTSPPTSGPTPPPPSSAPTSTIGPPDAPARPVARYAGSKVVVRWSAPSTNGATINRYVVSYGKRGARRVTDVRVGSARTKLVLRGLKAGTYTFTVAARSVAGTSAPSRAARVKVPARS